jgi:adenylate cyclase
MAEERVQRRLAAILAADVAGYSRLMGADEEGTLARLKSHRHDLFDPKIAEHRGRIVKTTGDGLLAEFASVVDALRCAVELQRGMAESNATVPPEQRIDFRLGLNVGDIVIEAGDIYGDGVNVAARLEALAEPGGICVSGRVQEDARGKIDLDFEDLGEQRLKNIVTPVRVHRVRLGSTKTGSRPALPLPNKPSIAVLPFANMSGDPEQEYFSDGITEDIITELSRFHSLFVIARNSSFIYKGRAVEVTRVGRELGVQFVIEGSVRKFGSRMRVTAQVVDAASSKHIWAERYDRDLQEMFALQDDLVHSVVATVGGRVEAAGRERTARLSSAGLESYDLHFRAKALWLKGTRAANEQARILEQRAIEIDPNNALAYAYYAECCIQDYGCDWVADLDQTRRTALEFAKRAVALDDADSSARWILSHAHSSACNFAEARIHIEKALDLNPNDTEARCYYGYFLTAAGEPDKALEQFHIARRHNPFDLSWVPWVVGQAYFGLRRYDEAIASFNQAYETNNEVNAWLAASYALTGRMKEAKEKLEVFLRIAEREMAHFPGQRSDEWLKYLQRGFPCQNPADFAHVCSGLRQAGLPV